MQQNIYDNPDFFDGYARLRENPLSFNTVIDDPAVRSLLPDVAGRRVLDLGCGTGGMCAYLRAQGAASVVGIDLSERMLVVAASRGLDGVSFRQEAVEELDEPEHAYDVIVSSLMFHYVEDLGAMLARVHRCLAPGGVLVFSTEHPVVTATRNPRGSSWFCDENGTRLFWALDHYHEEGRREIDWIVRGVVKYHRTIGTWVNALADNGFVLDRLLEPHATPEAEAAQPELLDERRRPVFLCIRARKQR